MLRSLSPLAFRDLVIRRASREQVTHQEVFGWVLRHVRFGHGLLEQ